VWGIAEIRAHAIQDRNAQLEVDGRPDMQTNPDGSQWREIRDTCDLLFMRPCGRQGAVEARPSQLLQKMTLKVV